MNKKEFYSIISGTIVSFIFVGTMLALVVEVVFFYAEKLMSNVISVGKITSIIFLMAVIIAIIFEFLIFVHKYIIVSLKRHLSHDVKKILIFEKLIRIVFFGTVFVRRISLLIEIPLGICILILLVLYIIIGWLFNSFQK